MRVLQKINLLDETSVGADTRSDAMDIRHLQGVAIQVVWTSTTAAATIKVEVSNDNETWSELSTTQAINNDDGSKMLEFNNANYAYVRVFLDYTSGTVSTFKAHLCGKGSH